MFFKKIRKILGEKRPSAFVVISGSVIKDPVAVEDIINISLDFDTTVCVGAGQQINDYFKKEKLPIEFCPVGRICRTEKQKQIANMILRKNRKIIKKTLRKNGVRAKVIFPVMEIGNKLCHINTDLMALNAYVSYDQVFIITMRTKVSQKEEWIKNIVDAFSTSMTEIRNLDKIHIYSK